MNRILRSFSLSAVTAAARNFRVGQQEAAVWAVVEPMPRDEKRHGFDPLGLFQEAEGVKNVGGVGSPFAPPWRRPGSAAARRPRRTRIVR